MRMEKMEIRQLKVGPMENLSYLIWEAGHKEAVLIDPAWQPEAAEEQLRKEKLELKLLLLTHAHPDHANAVRYFLEKNDGLALTVHKEDTFLLEEDIKPLRLLNGDEDLSAGPVRIKVIHTPGHTPGSVSYLAGGAVFTGDTLFLGQCGRADLPGSDPRALRRSLLKLAGLPGETVLYPGHSYNGNISTIGAQKEHNIYMKLAARGEAEFIKAAV
jgi:hydroxyacylglutathione hydrolase